MITEDIEKLKKNGFEVDVIPTGYIFTTEQIDGNREGDILIRKEACEAIQKIGKIEEIQIVGGKRVRIVTLRAIIGAG